MNSDDDHNEDEYSDTVGLSENLKTGRRYSQKDDNLKNYVECDSDNDDHDDNGTKRD